MAVSSFTTVARIHREFPGTIRSLSIIFGKIRVAPGAERVSKQLQPQTPFNWVPACSFLEMAGCHSQVHCRIQKDSRLAVTVYSWMLHLARHLTFLTGIFCEKVCLLLLGLQHHERCQSTACMKLRPCKKTWAKAYVLFALSNRPASTLCHVGTTCFASLVWEVC